MKSLIKVSNAQNDTISGIQILYDNDQEELYMITSAKLDHRLNIWKIPQL